MHRDLKKIISQMTLEEKAGMCSGLDFWHLKSVERLGIPEVMVSDGPHGLRKQDDKGDHLGMNDSIKAVCFPPAALSACSFDRSLMEAMGETIGKEAQANDVSVVLGPAVNIKRSPLCGRNFEYYSEDPYLAGEIAAAFINGVQSQHVGTSIKHFAANNQEYHRMSNSSEADERTLREIYFPAFETAVKKAQPYTFMCSYNQINGTFASENKWLLTDVLRNDWGFEGYVMSDWGAVNDRVKGLEAGLELEMPGSNGTNDALIMEAVKNGTLKEEVLDQAVVRILNIIYKYAAHEIHVFTAERITESGHSGRAGTVKQPRPICPGIPPGVSRNPTSRNTKRSCHEMKLNETRIRDAEGARYACIANGYCTCCDCEEYDRILNDAAESSRKPGGITVDDLARIAEAIKAHSETDDDVPAIAFALSRRTVSHFTEA